MSINFSRILSDRRTIYVLVILALSVPLLMKWSISPAPMKGAANTFSYIEKLEIKPGQIVFVSLDFGPNSIAENGAQTQAVVEHLFRKKIPLVFYSQTVEASGFLQTMPEKIIAKLKKEDAGFLIQYGVDWANLGYRVGSDLLLQNLGKSDHIGELFKTDAKGNQLKDLQIFSKVRTLQDIAAVVQLTSLTGTLEAFIRFFQTDGYRPPIIHGCTSIAIPKAYIYLDSGQISGVLEGIAGAAYYAELLKKRYPKSDPGDALGINTGLAVAHLMIILLIIFGNLSSFIKWSKLKAGAREPVC